MDTNLKSSFNCLVTTSILSIVSAPCTYFLNKIFEMVDIKVRPFWMMINGYLFLATIYWTSVKCSNVKDWLFHVAVVFTFTAVVDLIITLEIGGVITGFMTEYLKHGEPYLFTPFGSAICLFDGTGFLIMYLALVHLVSNKKCWRSLGIYWAAGILSAMIVLISTIFCGTHQPTYCIYLNMPYVFFPTLILIRGVGFERRPQWNSIEPRLLRVVDMLLAISSCCSVYILVEKGWTAISPSSQVVDFFHVLKHEPSLLIEEPGPYSRIQSFTYLFYVVPIQLVSAWYLLIGKLSPFMWELTLVQAGIMLPGQFATIVSSLDPKTPPELQSGLTDAHFWFYNMFVLVVPHLLLLRIKIFNIKNFDVPPKYSKVQ